MATTPCRCGCGERLPRGKFACENGWTRLPREMRREIVDAFRARDAEWVRIATGVALRWFRDHPKGGR